MKQFHICTISNDLNQYQQLKQSLVDTGFTDERCRYSLFDNSQENFFDPYQTINQLKTNTIEPYILYCHQDVLFNRGDGYQQLMQRVLELNLLDVEWAVAGNAGTNSKFQFVVRIADDNNSPNWTGKFPQQVYSLDENFLIIKTQSKAFCSANLKGFHFYAPDLCLNAISNGHSCYVINFHLTHLSHTKLTQSFWICKAEFYNYWSTRFIFCYVKTVTGITMCLSKYSVLRFCGAIKLIRKMLFLLNRATPFLQPRPYQSNHDKHHIKTFFIPK
jgi:hypothetical protein